MHKKRISLNSVEKSLSHSADKIRRRTLLCFERILVSKSFKQRRGEASRFCRIFFISQSQKTSPGNHSVFQKISGRQNYFMDKRGGGITIFRRSFCLTVPKYFIAEHFGVSEKFFYRKFSCIGGGGHHGFVEFFLSHRTETKSFVKEPYCFPEIFWYRKKIMDRRGFITIFSRNFHVSQCQKISWASLQCFRKFGVSKKLMHNRGFHNFSSKIFCLTVPKNFV